VVVNKPKYFIFEADLFFNRRGAEGTEEEKKESNINSGYTGMMLTVDC
jgi:hypothetical protein